MLRFLKQFLCQFFWVFGVAIIEHMHLKHNWNYSLVADKIRKECSVQSCQHKYPKLEKQEENTEGGTFRISKGSLESRRRKVDIEKKES